MPKPWITEFGIRHRLESWRIHVRSKCNQNSSLVKRHWINYLVLCVCPTGQAEFFHEGDAFCVVFGAFLCLQLLEPSPVGHNAFGTSVDSATGHTGWGLGCCSFVGQNLQGLSNKIEAYSKFYICNANLPHANSAKITVRNILWRIVTGSFMARYSVAPEKSSLINFNLNRPLNFILL